MLHNDLFSKFLVQIPHYSSTLASAVHFESIFSFIWLYPVLVFFLNHIFVATCFIFLLQSGCDVNSQSYSGNTALHNACGRDQADMVRLLLKSGADSSLKNYHNDTPVMVTKNKKVSENLKYIQTIQFD